MFINPQLLLKVGTASGLPGDFGEEILQERRLYLKTIGTLQIVWRVLVQVVGLRAPQR